MRTNNTRPQKNLTAEQRRRAERLTKRLTAFSNFGALLDYYRPIGGYRANLKPAAPALLARWTEAERKAERAEWDLQLNLALLCDLAEASVYRPRRVVVVRQAVRAA